MVAKYALTDDFIKVGGKKLFRIRALRGFGDVCEGDLGGWVSSYSNLSHEGSCWVYEDGRVTDEAVVDCDAIVTGSVVVDGKVRVTGDSFVSGKALLSGTVVVEGNSFIGGSPLIRGNVRISGTSVVEGNSSLGGNVVIDGDVIVTGRASLGGDVRVLGSSIVEGDAILRGNVLVEGNSRVTGHVIVEDDVVITGTAVVDGYATLSGDARVSSKWDYIVFQNTWSSVRYFTYTRSNNLWKAGCFKGTGEELISMAYKDSSLSGRMYEKYVRFVEGLELWKLVGECED